MGKKRTIAIKGAVPVLLIAAITEALSLWYFYPEMEGGMLVLLFLVLVGSLLVIGTSWMQISSLPPKIRVRTTRRQTFQKLRRRQKTPLTERLFGWVSSRLGGRTSTTIVLFVFFASLALVFLMTSEIAFLVYREIYASTPESIQSGLRTAYDLIRPLMGLRSVEKCLLAQNIPAISVAASSLIMLRRRR